MDSKSQSGYSGPKLLSMGSPHRFYPCLRPGCRGIVVHATRQLIVTLVSNESFCT
jgi:hypothetical protein